MKYIVSFVGILIVCFSFFFFKAEENEINCFCVNVVSNSNSENDEMIKFRVKEKISSFLNTENRSKDLSNNINDISFMTNQILSLYHCDYVCEVKVCEEKTPNLDYLKTNLVGKTCKIIYVKLGSGNGKESWQVFYE